MPTETTVAPSEVESVKADFDTLSQRHDSSVDDAIASAETDEIAEAVEEVAICTECEEVAEYTCFRCEVALCEDCSYHDEGGTQYYCRACADELVGVCAECDAPYANPCRDCGKKVCEDCRKSVIERWGWGGVGGQGGFTTWFPVIRTYCQEHGQHRIDAVKPTRKVFKGYDGSSPEW